MQLRGSCREFTTNVLGSLDRISAMFLKVRFMSNASGSSDLLCGDGSAATVTIAAASSVTGNATTRTMPRVYHKVCALAASTGWNALSSTRWKCGFAAYYSRLQRFLCHRLEDKTIHQKILNFFLSSAAFLLYKTAPEEFICPVIVKSCSASPSWH